MANNNPYSSFLNNGSSWGSLLLQQMPEATYFSSPTGMGFGAASPRQQRSYQQGFGDIYNQYLGALGTDLRQGGTGNVTFDQFLQTDPWTARYAQLPQAMRGANTGMYNPRTRFLYY